MGCQKRYWLVTTLLWQRWRALYTFVCSSCISWCFDCFMGHHCMLVRVDYRNWKTLVRLFHKTPHVAACSCRIWTTLRTISSTNYRTSCSTCLANILSIATKTNRIIWPHALSCKQNKQTSRSPRVGALGLGCVLSLCKLNSNISKILHRLSYRNSVAHTFANVILILAPEDYFLH